MFPVLGGARDQLCSCLCKMREILGGRLSSLFWSLVLRKFGQLGGLVEMHCDLPESLLFGVMVVLSTALT